jgi:hypothetical protein
MNSQGPYFVHCGTPKCFSSFREISPPFNFPPLIHSGVIERILKLKAVLSSLIMACSNARKFECDFLGKYLSPPHL